MSNSNEQTIVINDMLSFVSCKMKLYSRDKFIKCLKKFYPENAAIEAEKTLKASLPEIELTGRQKEKDPFVKLCNSFSLIPEDALPVFVCKNLNNVPKFDVDEDDGECPEDDDSEELINEQKFIKSQIAEISAVVYQLKDQIQLLANQRSKAASDDSKKRNRASSSSKAKTKQVTPKKVMLPTQAPKKGLAYLQTLIDQEEEEKVNRLSLKKEPNEETLSDMEEDDMEEVVEEEEDENILLLMANRRQRALAKNAEAEILNGKRLSSPQKRIMNNVGTIKRSTDPCGSSWKKTRVFLPVKEEEEENEGVDEDEMADEEVEGDSCGRRGSRIEKSHIQVEHVTDKNFGDFSIFKCSLCNFSTNDAVAIERHDCPQIYSGTEEDEDANTFKYFCFECKFRSNSKALYEKHIIKHPQGFSCPICPEKITDQEKWPRHVVQCILNENLTQSDYVCSICNIIYATPNALKIHKCNHSMNRPFECMICKYRYVTPEKLASHVNMHQNKGYKCPFCFYIHRNKYTFLTHLRGHTGDTPFACSICDYRSTSVTAVNSHILTHTDKKDIECEVCNTSFKTIHKLKAHMKTHDKDGEFKCPECKKGFKTAWLMTLHHCAVHIGSQPFPCIMCDFTAETTTILKEHMDSHEKLLIYDCSLCSYRTNYSDQLDSHMKKQHLGLSDD